MKYRLKDLCSITKGATGIMKADGGKYPLVALSDERRSHSEYQFDAKAVIVPLISSTGHGHASMKRVHYQEGKFALGNILCAVIPNDEIQLNAKYLHLYLQQFKETLLVPLMKGAANVSLPMNKLADVEIEVPSLERQLEIIELEEEAAEYKNEMEERLIAQGGDVTKLRQAILREALQGKLVKQSKNEGNGFELLSKIRSERGTFLTGKKGKKEIVQEVKNEEVLFQIPESWAWCRLGEVTEILNGRAYKASELLQKGTPVLRVGNFFTSDRWYYSDLKLDENKYCDKGDLLYAWSASFGPKIWDGGKVIYHYHIWKIDHSKQIDKKFLYYYLLFDTEMIKSNSRGVFMLHMTKERMEKRLLPLPPFAEQNRIVKRIEQLMQLCDELQYSIQQSKIENEKLLQGALRDALKKEEVAA
jgi:type I restriction enzyme S subunit